MLHPSPLSPNGGEPSNLWKHHLVAYSPDWAYIAIAQQGDSIIRILDSLLGTILWLINTDMKIQEIKITGRTIFVVDTQKLASWDLEAGGITPGAHKTFVTGACRENSILSNDCSLVISSSWERIFLYDLKTQKILQVSQHSREDIGDKEQCSQKVDIQTINDIRISPDGHQVWFSYNGGCFNHFAKLDIKGDWHWSPMEIVGVDPDKSWSWINLFSPCGYQVGKVSEWAIDFRGRKILWFPPHWRVYSRKKVRWDGDFLAFVGDNHPTPIIIKFQPQHTPPHSC